jgi:hypothetical protein
VRESRHNESTGDEVTRGTPAAYCATKEDVPHPHDRVTSIADPLPPRRLVCDRMVAEAEPLPARP